MQTPNFHADIMVLGGGLVGCACALALKQLGYAVTLLEQHPPIFLKHQQDDWDARIYAISPGNVAWLESLGVWQTLALDRICRVEKMDIRGDNCGQLVFDAYEAHYSGLSYIVESRVLHQALWQTMTASGVQIVAGMSAQTLTHSENHACLTLADGRQYHANLLIGADGARSWLREQLGIQAPLHAYQQMGVVANFSTQLAHQQVARQWFSPATQPESILAFLPLPGQRMSMVWSTSQQHADALLAVDEASFVREVTEAGGGVLGTMQLMTKPLAFSLNLQIAENMISDACILMGDAAHLVHPMAGQGVNLGFRDVVSLIEILKHKKSVEGVGCQSVLRRYERARQTDILAMKTVTNGLYDLFLNTQQPMIKKIRNEGMRWLNQRRAIKQLLIQQAVL